MGRNDRACAQCLTQGAQHHPEVISGCCFDADEKGSTQNIMRNVIGLDLSLTSTGVAVGDRQFAITSKLSGVERLNEISRAIAELFVDMPEPAVVMEGYSFGSRNSQSHSIGELGGVVKLTLWGMGVPFVIVPPTSRAKFATGRGNASKSEVVSAVSARTGIVWEGKGADDKCDAWLLQEIGLWYFGEPRFEWPASHVAGLEKIDFGPFGAGGTSE